MGGDRIILDSGAVSALAEEEEPIRVVLRKVIAEGGTIHVPAPVISEAVTGSGPRDSRVNRALKSCVIMPLDESLARAAGALRYRHPAVGTIDAMVVACGDAVPGSIIITGDLADLRLLAAEQQRTVVIGF